MADITNLKAQVDNLVDKVKAQTTVDASVARNAVEQLQAKLGLKVDGWAGEITKAAVAAALEKLT